MKEKKSYPASDSDLRALLKRYACPVPFHEVRTRFMGNIATPDMTASPMQIIRDLWGGDLPEFESQEDAEQLLSGLMQGLWNRLSAHQRRTNPFQLARVKAAPPSYEHLARLSNLRRQELDGLIEGLFAGKEEMDFPESAHKAIGVLSEIRAMFAGVHNMARNPPGPADTDSLKTTSKHLQEMTRIAEVEINRVIQSCKRARAHALETRPSEKPTLH